MKVTSSKNHVLVFCMTKLNKYVACTLKGKKKKKLKGPVDQPVDPCEAAYSFAAALLFCFDAALLFLLMLALSIQMVCLADYVDSHIQYSEYAEFENIIWLRRI